ncbi:MAG: vanadium-dependent haloperoxidase [Pseudomonadota bacterium]
MAEDRPQPSSTTEISRRKILSASGAALALAGGMGLSMPAPAQAGSSSAASAIGNAQRRRRKAAQLRERAARAYLKGRLPRQRTNGDDQRYSDRRASFFKTLPQNDLGEVDQHAYRALLKALRTKRQSDFNAIPLSLVSERKLANPQGAYAFELTGLDGQATRIPAAPRFDGATQAAEMGEVYWQALTRDVAFDDYDSDSLVQTALSDLNNFSAKVGPTDNGQITAGTLFRGETPGDLIGPYISQFLWLDVPYGPSTIIQKYDRPVAGIDFGTAYADWLAIQRGAVIGQNTFDIDKVYISNNRALGEYVHRDYSFQAYLNAALIMFSFGPDALAASNPYLDIDNQGAFVTFGPPAIGDLVTKAARLALTGAWYQKWLVHRRLRPEVFAGRIENQRIGNKDYGINAEIMNSVAVSETVADFSTALLPLAFPEGSPTHPSYPAGHACVAGACATILKAFFNEDFEIPAPMVATPSGDTLVPWGGAPLTLGNEINKLANNISIGRDAAGVHYRSDGIDGLTGGEQQALGMLQDYSRTYNEDFGGFTLTRFDGSPVLVRNGRIIG